MGVSSHPDTLQQAVNVRQVQLPACAARLGTGAEGYVGAGADQQRRQHHGGGMAERRPFSMLER